ncbi:MAG: hypothetical protein K2W82_07825 [Candidatus Obscuribacterales bacterium]|nr:hypothetical protein [Candidatus Obscuribacterales bacterium]
MTLEDRQINQPDNAVRAESNEESKTDSLNLVFLAKPDASKEQPGQIEIAASSGFDLSREFSQIKTDNNRYREADAKALFEFPGPPLDHKGEDPHAQPRQLVRREILENPALSDEETLELKAWRKFPGLDENQNKARELTHKYLLGEETTNEEKAFIRSVDEFPGSGKQMAHLRDLSQKQYLNESSLTAKERAELESWRSFPNSAEKLDRPRELMHKALQAYFQPGNRQEGYADSLSPQEKAELGSWVQFPEPDYRSSELRKLAQRDLLYGDDPIKGLQPAEIAKLEAWTTFENPDRRFNQARELAQASVLNQYDKGPALTKEQAAELGAWANFPDLDKRFDQAREIYIRGELDPTTPLSHMEKVTLSDAYGELTGRKVIDPLFADEEHRKQYSLNKTIDVDLRRMMPGRHYGASAD